MSTPSAWNGLSLVVMGALVIRFRRSLAREKKRSYDTFDRALDEDGAAWWIGAIGGLVVLFGAALFGMWAGA